MKRTHINYSVRHNESRRKFNVKHVVESPNMQHGITSGWTLNRQSLLTPFLRQQTDAEYNPIHFMDSDNHSDVFARNQSFALSV